MERADEPILEGTVLCKCCGLPVDACPQRFIEFINAYIFEDGVVLAPWQERVIARFMVGMDITRPRASVIITDIS